MAIDAKDVGELQKALNDAAGKASALWMAFVTFELYLAIAFGSVTHRDLFLENPIKLPVLNVELSLVAFFVVAPILLLIFHFYVFLQLHALARKAQDYDTLLRQAAPVAADRQFLRQRLDAFPVLQFLAGPFEQRTGFGGFSLRLMAWITLVAAPVLVLLQAQITFLPYHLEWAVWLQRIVLMIDLAVIWYFWDRVRSADVSILANVPSIAWQAIGRAATFCVVIFSVAVASFPGERVALRSGPRTNLFEGQVDEVSGRPRSWFSNRLILTNQSFYEPDQHDRVEVSRSFRSRDLRGAVLNRADLRKADFTGAMLNEARLEFTKLDKARFACADRGNRPWGAPEGPAQWPDDGCTWLQRAILISAEMKGVSLDRARLQGAVLDSAQLQGASLGAARLQGASLISAQLQGALLDSAQLQGAGLDATQLEGASLGGAWLQGTSLNDARLQGASLYSAQLQGTLLDRADLQGASLDWAGLQGASLAMAELEGASLWGAYIWRVNGSPSISLKLVGLEQVDPDARPWGGGGSDAFAKWRADIVGSIPLGPRHDLTVKRLEVLEPNLGKQPKEVLDSTFWKNVRSSQPHGEQRERDLAGFIVDLACRDYAAPYLARGLLWNGRIAATRSQVEAVAGKLRKGRDDPSACPGVKGFTDSDWTALDELIAAAPKATESATPLP